MQRDINVQHFGPECEIKRYGHSDRGSMLTMRFYHNITIIIIKVFYVLDKESMIIFSSTWSGL